MKCLFIFRRDFRYKDNTTLNELLKSEYNIKEILPIFNFDPIQIDNKMNKYYNSNSVQFMIEALLNLSPQPLFCYNNILTTLDIIYKEWPFDVLGFNKDYTPFSINRDKKIEQWTLNKNIRFVSFDDVLLMPYNLIKNKTGGIYQKFTPYYNEASKDKYKKYIPPFSNKAMQITELINNCSFYKKTINSIASSKNNKSSSNKSPNNLFLDPNNDLDKFYDYNPNLAFHGNKKPKISLDLIKNYKKTRDFPSLETTNLAAYFKFGIISVRKIYYKYNNYPEFIRQLFWREFYYNLGLYIQTNDSIYWTYDANTKKNFNLWKNGKTGHDIIDAGMNQLNISGTMHNRLRMIVASYLCKNLKIDWHKGEKYFASKLIDYDPIQNNRNWCYIASITPESQPKFRIFNPDRQEAKFDKDRIYIKYWLNNG
jgi:deoxyribodipyrimidine photo-lyase